MLRRRRDGRAPFPGGECRHSGEEASAAMARAPSGAMRTKHAVESRCGGLPKGRLLQVGGERLACVFVFAVCGGAEGAHPTITARRQNEEWAMHRRLSLRRGRRLFLRFFLLAGTELPQPPDLAGAPPRRHRSNQNSQPRGRHETGKPKRFRPMMVRQRALAHCGPRGWVRTSLTVFASSLGPRLSMAARRRSRPPTKTRVGRAASVEDGDRPDISITAAANRRRYASMMVCPTRA